MNLNDFILDNLDRIQEALTEAVDSLTYEELTWQPGAEANSIGFILWHQVRCEDTYIQTFVRRQPQVWVSEKWYQKLNLPDDAWDNGNDYTVEQVAGFPVPEFKDLLGYAEAVRAQTVACLKGITPDKLDEEIQPPEFWGNNLGKLFSYMLCELTQHIGQIAYLRGLQRGLNK
jgi:uncharacterized damage-inducible protein DinB